MRSRSACTHSAIALPLTLSLALALAPRAAEAQAITTFQKSDDPLEISADFGIEWRRDSKVYIASGNARAAQGDLAVFAETLTAHYRDGAAGDTEIYRIEAEGQVRIVSLSETVYGDLGIYDLDKGYFIMTGDDLRMEAGADLITARDSLEYWEADQIAVANGDAVATREDKRVQADKLVAHFAPDAEGKLAIDTVDATGNVRISTATEFASGNSGVYYAQKQLATLTGAVKVTRGQNQLNGEYAEVNLVTGVSRLLGAPPGQRAATPVRGLLVPERKPERETAP